MSLNLTEVCIILELEMYFCQVVLKSLLTNIFLPILAEVNDLIFVVHLFYSFSSFCMSHLCLFLFHRTWYTRAGLITLGLCIEGCVFVCVFLYTVSSRAEGQSKDDQWAVVRTSIQHWHCTYTLTRAAHKP